MRIISYNIWNSPVGMPERKTHIIAELQSVDADILCLQEVADSDTHHNIETALSFPYSYMNEPAGISVFSNYRLSPVFDTEFSASVLIHADTTLFLTNLHLPWNSASAREKAIAEIVRKSERIHYADADQCMIAGDFNCSENSSVHRFLLGDQSLDGLDAYYFDLAEAWSDITGTTAEATLNVRENPRWKGLKTIEKSHRFDRILVKNSYPSSLPVMSNFRLFGKSVLSAGAFCPSDHYGVLAELLFY